MESISYINGVTLVLIGIFNAAISTRIIKIIFDGMNDEEIPVKKKVFNCFKAGIVVNTILGLITIIQKYYK